MKALNLKINIFNFRVGMKLDLVLNEEERKERFKIFHAKKKIDQNPPAVVGSSQTTTGKHNWNSGASVISNGIQRLLFYNYQLLPWKTYLQGRFVRQPYLPQDHIQLPLYFIHITKLIMQNPMLPLQPPAYKLLSKHRTKLFKKCDLRWLY